jgi:hypothetical protein
VLNSKLFQKLHKVYLSKKVIKVEKHPISFTIISIIFVCDFFEPWAVEISLKFDTIIETCKIKCSGLILLLKNCDAPKITQKRTKAIIKKNLSLYFAAPSKGQPSSC